MIQRKQRVTLAIPGFSYIDSEETKKEALRSISFSEENSDAFAAYNLDPLLTRISPKHAFSDIATPKFQNLEAFEKNLEKLSVENSLDIQKYNTDEHQQQTSHISTVRESLRRKSIQNNSMFNSTRKSSKLSIKISDHDEDRSRFLCINQDTSCKCLII